MDSIAALSLFGALNLSAGFAAGLFVRARRSRQTSTMEGGGAPANVDVDAVARVMQEIDQSAAEQMKSWASLQETLNGSCRAEDFGAHHQANRCYGRLLQAYHDRLTELDPEFCVVSRQFAEELSKTRHAVGELAQELHEAERCLESLDSSAMLRRLQMLEEANKQLREELAQARKQLAEQSEQLNAAQGVIFEDDLTGFYNRRGFELVYREFNAEFGKTGRPFCLLRIDLDHLKQINHQYGDDAGDALLKVAARIVQECCAPRDQIAHLGCGQFVVLSFASSLETARQLAERIRQRMEATRVDHGNHQLQVTCSIGVVRVEPHCTGQQLLRVANELLFAAKDAGRNTVRWLMIPETTPPRDDRTNEERSLQNASSPLAVSP